MIKPISCFDLKPSLRIVGTFHALNDDDKSFLDEVVQSSDFVGIEWDTLRNDSKWFNKYIVVNEDARNELLGDYLYLGKKEVCALNSIWLSYKLQNAIFARITGRCSSHSPDGNEFLYVEQKCFELNKPCYKVDNKITKTLHNLVSSIDDIKNASDKRQSIIKAFDLPERNENMLKRLENHEGSLDNIERKGALIVGMTHLELYKKMNA